MTELILGLSFLGTGVGIILHSILSSRVGAFHWESDEGNAGEWVVREDEPVKFWIALGALLVIGVAFAFTGVMFLSTLF